MGKIKDYFWHITLPVTALVIGGFASLTMLTKNSFLDEINKPYVLTARAKGLSENRILYGHIFRNAMLIVSAGFPVYGVPPAYDRDFDSGDLQYRILKLLCGSCDAFRFRAVARIDDFSRRPAVLYHGKRFLHTSRFRRQEIF